MNTSPTNFGQAAEYRSKHPFRTLGSLLRPDRGTLGVAFIFFVIKSLPVWLLPVLTANIIDIVSKPENHSANEILINGLLVVLAILQNPFTHTYYWKSMSVAIRNMEVRLRSDICRRLQLLSISYLKQSSTGRLHTKILRDVETLEQVIRQASEGLLLAIFSTLISLGIAAVRAPGFLPFFLVTIPAGLLLRLAMKERLHVANREFRTSVEGMSSKIINMIEMIPMTRAHAAEDAEMGQVQKNLSKVKDSGLRLDSIHAWFHSVSWATFTSLNAACLVLGGWLCYTKTLSISAGDVVLMSTYFAVISNAVMQVANIMPQIFKGLESMRSISEVMESPDLELNHGKKIVASVRGDFQLNNVSFTYPGSKGGSLREVELHVDTGETLGIVGPSGSGKSTLMSLLLGFHRPTKGKILLDGVDMNTLDLRTYRRFVSVVAQETLLFPGTLRDNLVYGLPGVDEARITRALSDSNSLEFVERMPDGILSKIGEHGSGLSGGQRQRLAIARALIRNPRVLILDEATSALDAASEGLVQEALDRLMKNRTTFIVAHRLATIRKADRILVIEDGRITEQGSHFDLVHNDGLYGRLHELQKLH